LGRGGPSQAMATLRRGNAPACAPLLFRLDACRRHRVGLCPARRPPPPPATGGPRAGGGRGACPPDADSSRRRHGECLLGACRGRPPPAEGRRCQPRGAPSGRTVVAAVRQTGRRAADPRGGAAGGARRRRPPLRRRALTLPRVTAGVRVRGGAPRGGGAPPAGPCSRELRRARVEAGGADGRRRPVWPRAAAAAGVGCRRRRGRTPPADRRCTGKPQQITAWFRSCSRWFTK